MWTNVLRVVFASCALWASGCFMPLPVVRLSPMLEVARWQQGRAVMQDEQNGVVMAITHERVWDDKLVFRVELWNGSTEALLFDAAEGRYAACDVAGTIAQITECGGAYAVMNPEKILLEFDRQHARNEADHKNLQVFNASLMILSVTADIANAQRGRRSDGNHTLLLSQSAGADRAEHETSQMRLVNERDFWHDATFRRTSLMPGESAAGLVVIGRLPNAKAIELRLVAGNHEFRFPFAQRLYDSRQTIQRRHQ